MTHKLRGQGVWQDAKVEVVALREIARVSGVDGLLQMLAKDGVAVSVHESPLSVCRRIFAGISILFVFRSRAPSLFCPHPLSLSPICAIESDGAMLHRVIQHMSSTHCIS